MWIVRAYKMLLSITRWIGIVTMAFMMFLVTVSVIARAFKNPILGDNELVQLAMVILIMFGVIYSESDKTHISIGLIVDRLSKRTQLVFDAFASLLTWIVCMIIAYVHFNAMNNSMLTTDLLGIPHAPFKFIIAIGFFLWGIEAIINVIKSFINFNKNDSGKHKEEVV